MSELNASSRPETGEAFGYEPVLRPILVTRYLVISLIGWAVATAALLGGAAAGLSLAICFALAVLVLPVTLFIGYHFARQATRLIAQPADALMRVLPAEDQRRLIESAEEDRSLAASHQGRQLAALVESAMRRVSRDATIISEVTRAREEAEAANLAKSHFLANMSHQLRTPLNAIVGYATLLQEDAVASSRPEQVADLGRVLQASRNLLEIINDMLDLSKIEVGKTTFQRSIVDIGSLVKSVMTSFDLEQQGNGNLLAADVEPGIGILIGDPGKVRQCLLNLVGNALKFTEHGEVRLNVNAVERDGNDVIEFTVTDTGVGMTAEQTGALFRDLKVDQEGMANGPKLGLAITNRLATMMGGTVTVRSVPGQGSAFTLAVPREMPRSVPAEDVLPFIDKGNELDAAAGKKALIVDDDPIAIDLMARWLSRMGFSILTAGHGEEGLALAREHKPAVILLDVLMPGMDGYGVLEALRADPEVSHIPVVIISVVDDRSAALRAGASEALIKPVQPQQLEQLLDVYCRRLRGEILVIEDDPDSGAIIQRTAAQVGLSSRVARNGEEGLEMIRKAPPAAIVLDLGLPGMSGFQVLDALAADSKLKHIPVLIVSGHEIGVAEHQAIERSGGIFHPKGHSSPHEIAQSLKKVVAR